MILTFKRSTQIKLINLIKVYFRDIDFKVEMHPQRQSHAPGGGIGGAAEERPVFRNGFGKPAVGGPGGLFGGVHPGV